MITGAYTLFWMVFILAVIKTCKFVLGCFVKTETQKELKRGIRIFELISVILLFLIAFCINNLWVNN